MNKMMIAAAGALFVASAASAQFGGQSWTILGPNQSFSGAGQALVGQSFNLVTGSGAVSGNATETGASMILVSGNSLIRGLSGFTTTASFSGLVSVNWSISTVDSGGWDGAGFILNGVFTTFAINSSNPTSGVASFNVNVGDTFGFAAFTADGSFGSATTTLTNFVPAPGAVALLGLAGLAGRRRRR